MEKDFDEFIETIDSESYDTIVFAARQAMIASKRTGSEALAFFIARELLERYHVWMNS